MEIQQLPGCDGTWVGLRDLSGGENTVAKGPRVSDSLGLSGRYLGELRRDWHQGAEGF